MARLPATKAPRGLPDLTIGGFNRRDLLVPLGLVFIVALMIIPLPPIVLDLSLATNITLSGIMLCRRPP